MQDVLATVEHYTDLGFDTLPLRAGTKKALSKEWQRLTPEQMWRDAPMDANLGLRAGGHAKLAVIDCDDKERPGTLVNVQSLLDGLGYTKDSYPLIRTASGVGGHIYILWGGGLANHARHLSEKIGSGEFRYGQGAYVVAPPSEVASRKYELIQGDLLHRPFLTAKDVLQILKVQDDNSKGSCKFGVVPETNSTPNVCIAQ